MLFHLRSAGTPVTPETFMAWRDQFDLEMRLNSKVAVTEASTKLTGDSRRYRNCSQNGSNGKLQVANCGRKDWSRMKERKGLKTIYTTILMMLNLMGMISLRKKKEKTDCKREPLRLLGPNQKLPFTSKLFQISSKIHSICYCSGLLETSMNIDSQHFLNVL